MESSMWPRSRPIPWLCFLYRNDSKRRRDMLKCVLAVVVLLFTTTAFAQDARTVIDNASKAMGPLKTVEYSGSGFDFAIGQNANPNLPWPKFIDKTYKRVINFEAPALRMDRLRAQGENPPRGGGQQPVYGDQP